MKCYGRPPAITFPLHRLTLPTVANGSSSILVAGHLFFSASIPRERESTTLYYPRLHRNRRSITTLEKKKIRIFDSRRLIHLPLLFLLCFHRFGSRIDAPSAGNSCSSSSSNSSSSSSNKPRPRKGRREDRARRRATRATATRCRRARPRPRADVPPPSPRRGARRHPGPTRRSCPPRPRTHGWG